MMTFDYETAWADIARPSVESLPQNIRDLVLRVADECADLHQLADCSMPWPPCSDLRSTFEKIPAEWLALASHAVNAYGHWWPSADSGLTAGANRLPAGAHWKFSHYADQSLRARLGLSERGREGFGLTFAVHEGAIGLCRSTRHSWQWVEIAPATQGGMVYAEEARAMVRAAIDSVPDKRRTREMDHEAWKAFETLNKGKATLPGWAASGSPFWPMFADSGRYLVEEAEMAARREARRPEPDREAMKARVIREAAEKIAKMSAEETIKRDGYVWLIENKIPTDNAIYYGHTGRWAFGWRKTIPEDLKGRMLDVLSEFPFDYDFVTTKY